MGYPIPEIDQIDGEVCVNLKLPNEPNFLRAFWGQFYELTRAASWGMEPTRDQEELAYRREVAQFWRELYAVNRDANIEYVCPDENDSEEDEAPYWSEADAQSAAGTGNNWEYIGDWAVTAFLASAGSPAAALIYRTLVSKARLAFQTKDAGDIADVFIDGILALSIPTAAVGGITEIIEAEIDLVAFATDHSLPAGERIIEIIARAA